MQLTIWEDTQDPLLATNLHQVLSLNLSKQQNIWAHDPCILPAVSVHIVPENLNKEGTNECCAVISTIRTQMKDQ